jgi:uncharacterized protein YeaO (DUF488 family)
MIVTRRSAHPRGNSGTLWVMAAWALHIAYSAWLERKFHHETQDVSHIIPTAFAGGGHLLPVA